MTASLFAKDFRMMAFFKRTMTSVNGDTTDQRAGRATPGDGAHT